MSIDPDDEVTEFMNGIVNVGRAVWHKLEQDRAKKRALRPARTYNEMYGGFAAIAADVARDRSTSPDPTARDLVAWQAFSASEAKWVCCMPGAAKLPGAPGKLAAIERAQGYRYLRMAYEAETGCSALDGSRLSRAECERRRMSLKPEWFEEARLLRDSYVDSKAGQNARNRIAAAREESERRLAIRIIRKTPAAMCR